MIKNLFKRFFNRNRKTEESKLSPPSSRRRMMRYQIAPEAMIYMFTVGKTVGVVKGIMPGSRFCGFTVDKQSNLINLFVEHPLYSAIDMNCEIPVGETIELRDIDKKDYLGIDGEM